MENSVRVNEQEPPEIKEPITKIGRVCNVTLIDIVADRIVSDSCDTLARSRDVDPLGAVLIFYKGS